ncbi:MAG: hypothetical protein AMS22_15660 [Thiotrichales bacterium SG8_50]|nr:MAG: hypothetical protein AMS22_15660 [Thiotrichales bacterium SG8_50]
MAKAKNGLKIFIADDHKIVRDGLKSMLQQDGHTIVGEAADADSTLASFGENKPDVIVLDLNMPGAVGLNVLKKIVEMDHTAKVVIYSLRASNQLIAEAYNSGALAYVTKSSDPEEVLTAVRTVNIRFDPANGQKIAKRYYMPGMEKRLKEMQLSDSRVPDPRKVLDGEELEVFRLLASGMKGADVATTVHKSANTISTYTKNISMKLGIERDQFTTVAIDYMILVPE